MDADDHLRIVPLRDRPDLAPVVTDWIWQAFGDPEGSDRHDIAALVGAALGSRPIQQTFVLMNGDMPVATASLVAQDLESRPDLTPWLASVFVMPAARRRGLAGRLVAAVEQAARVDAGVDKLWLYTRTAEAIYRRCGWQTQSRFLRHDADHALMCKSLA